jgi:hypothetical protein
MTGRAGRGRRGVHSSLWAPLGQPISGIISDPVERAGLGLEAGNVFLLPIWISAYDMPLNPKLAGLRSEREFAYGLGHSANMRRFPQDGHRRPRSASIQLRHDPEANALNGKRFVELRPHQRHQNQPSPETLDSRARVLLNPAERYPPGIAGCYVRAENG